MASRWRHCADLTGSGIEPWTSRTDSVCLTIELTDWWVITTSSQIKRFQIYQPLLIITFRVFKSVINLRIIKDAINNFVCFGFFVKLEF